MADAFTLRRASKADARALAELIDIAGEGFATYLWSQSAEAGASPLDVGIRRAQREEGGFSYRNAVVAESGNEIAGLLLGYRLADPYDTGDLSALPDMVRPLVELESQAPGSWYVNALAVYPKFRNRQLGSQLLAEADRVAAEQKANAVSLIVDDANEVAKRLYVRHGYEVRARRPLVPFPGFGHTGDWLLMMKTLA